MMKKENAAGNLNSNLFKALNHKANEKGWKVDNVGDLPRVLRLPGTMNIKNPEDIRMARIVETTDRFYTVEEMKNLLPDVTPQKAKKVPVEKKQRVIKSDVPVQRQEDEYPPAFFDLIKSKCGFIAHCVDDAADLPEPEWYALLTIAGRCENGEELCHQISKDYPGYDEEETELKIEHATLDAPGPVTCAAYRNDDY